MKRDSIKLISKFIEEGKYSSAKGEPMESFEREAATLFGNKYGISTCNGSSSLYLSLFCIQPHREVDAPDEVIMPVYNFHGAASVVCAAGLKPIFCDIDPETLTIDFDECKKLINKKTLAVMVIQPWGNVVDIDKMQRLREETNAYFISDSSHAHGALWEGKPIGSYFDINCASFGLGKLISGGELGALTTDDPVFRDRALLFSHTNRVSGNLLTKEYEQIPNAVGIKFRPHLFALILGLSEFGEYQDRREIIAENVHSIKNELESRGVNFTKQFPKATRTYWKLNLTLPNNIDPSELIDALKKSGVQAENHNYKTLLNEHPIFSSFYKLPSEKIFPNAGKVTKRRIIQITLESLLDKGVVKKITDVVKQYV